MSKFLDTINSFVLEFKEELSAYDINQFKSNYSYMKEGKLPSLTGMISPYLYCDYITKTLDNLSGVTNNIDEMEEFFSKVYKSAYLADRNITIPLQADEDIDKIRPEYLASVSNDFSIVIKRILDKTIDISDIKKKYVSGEYFDKIKKQLVKTTVVVNDVRDLMKMDSPTMVKVDNMYLQNNVIPFLRSYTQNAKDLTAIGLNLKGRINDTYMDITNTINAINDMQTSGKIDANTITTINYYKYNFIRGYMNLCAYISGMLIRKISYYTYNMMAYVNLYNMIYNYFPEGELILHESVIDGDLSDIDDSTLVQSIIDNDLNVIIPHIQNAIEKKKMELANILSKKYNRTILLNQKINSEKYPYDIYPYASANKTISDIAECMKEFETNIQNPDLVVDDVIEKSRLSETFTTKYGNVLTSIPNIDYYITQSTLNLGEEDCSVMLALFNDIDHFEKNVKIISDNIYRVYKYIEALIDKYSVNSNGMDEPTFSEVNSFLNQLMKNYKDYILLLTKRILDRLDNLTDALEDAEVDDGSEEVFVPYDYAFSTYSERYDDIINIEKELFEEMYKEYYALRNHKDRGVKIVYEEVKEADSNTTTATVQTDANTQHEKPSEKEENNTQKQDNTTINNPEKKENLVDKFLKWFRGIIDKFKNKSKTMTTTNNKWLAGVKNDILNLNTDNTTITLAKYEGLEIKKLSSDITTTINKINAIYPSNLPNELKGGRNKAESYLFGTIPAKISKADSFGARIKQFFTHGNTEKTSLVSYSGADAKSKIEEMIGFCEGYQNMYTKLSDELDKLTKAAADKQSAIVDSLNSGSNTKPTTESVMLEADQNEVKVGKTQSSGSEESKEKLNASTMLTSITREYVGSILTVVEKKYLDYIKVLDKLAPKKTDEKPDEGKEKSDEGENKEKSDEGEKK